jgi:hypothetical protein
MNIKISHCIAPHLTKEYQRIAIQNNTYAPELFHPLLKFLRQTSAQLMQTSRLELLLKGSILLTLLPLMHQGN